ncbi:hypothetical protein DL96DRAFT_1621473 [Flagelloscypha sp. PMI_526]|nr:hypothetical protein DL96DRAFT_1621473 [Flagelloscypha sp. PMI_526]
MSNDSVPQHHSLPFPVETPWSRSSRCSRFLNIIERSPDVGQYVRKVRILNPQKFVSNHDLDPANDPDNDTTSLHALLAILPRLSHATDVLIWADTTDYTGRQWKPNPWIGSAVASLPALQTITTENFTELGSLFSSSFFLKIKGLALLLSQTSFDRQQAVMPGPLCPLSTFRLHVHCDLQDSDNFLSAPFMKCLDISNVRHLALARPFTPSPMGRWLSSLITHGSTEYLETLVLELDDIPDSVRVPPSSLPNVKDIWLLVKTRFCISSSEYADGWRTWLSSLFAGCAQQHGVVVTFFLPARTLVFEQFVCRMGAALEGKQVRIGILGKRLQANGSSPTSGLPEGWIRFPYESEHTIWTAFYEL